MGLSKFLPRSVTAGQGTAMTVNHHTKVQMPALPIRNKQGSMDMTNDVAGHSRKTASVYQMAQNAASLNST